MTHTTQRLAPATLNTRASAFALAAMVTLSVMFGVAQIANTEYLEAETGLQMARMETTPVQTIVITGHRQSKA